MRKLDLTSSDKLYCKQTLDRILILIVGQLLSGYTPSLSFQSHASTLKLDYMSKQQKMFLALICSIEHDWFIGQPIAASNLLNKPIIKCFRSHSLPTSFVYPCRNFFLIKFRITFLRLYSQWSKNLDSSELRQLFNNLNRLSWTYASIWFGWIGSDNFYFHFGGYYLFFSVSHCCHSYNLS